MRSLAVWMGALAVAASAGCGSSACPAGRVRSADGVCVNENMADFVTCINNVGGAKLSRGEAQQLSASFTQFGASYQQVQAVRNEYAGPDKQNQLFVIDYCMRASGGASTATQQLVELQTSAQKDQMREQIEAEKAARNINIAPIPFRDRECEAMGIDLEWGDTSGHAYRISTTDGSNPGNPAVRRVIDACGGDNRRIQTALQQRYQLTDARRIDYCEAEAKRQCIASHARILQVPLDDLPPGYAVLCDQYKQKDCQERLVSKGWFLSGWCRREDRSNGLFNNLQGDEYCCNRDPRVVGVQNANAPPYGQFQGYPPAGYLPSTTGAPPCGYPPTPGCR
jgi:hypothetical protein